MITINFINNNNQILNISPLNISDRRCTDRRYSCPIPAQQQGSNWFKRKHTSDSSYRTNIPYEINSRHGINVRHALFAGFNQHGEPVGGHTFLSNNIRILEGTKKTKADSHGVYQARVQMQNENGEWVTKYGSNTMFPQDWSAEKVVSEVDAAFDGREIKTSPKGTRKWSGVTPLKVKVQGYLFPNITVHPVMDHGNRT